MAAKIDKHMLQIYLRISGVVLFALIFVLGYLYYIYPNPLIIANLLLISILEILGLDKINAISEETQNYNSNLLSASDDISIETILNNIGQLQDRPGFIYVMRRSDGIYKIGRTNSTVRRITELITDYRKQFVLVKRFTVPDTIAFETIALQLTFAYRYDEQHRTELRMLTGSQLTEFLLVFEKICKKAVTL